MVIKEKDNFTSMVAKMLNGLGYDNVQVHENDALDITAHKDGEKYCFMCRYDIDAIGDKRITELIEASKNGKFDKAVYVTNSSFLSSAKRKGEEAGVLLWDRNTIDRMAIGVSEKLEDVTIEEEKSYAPIIIGGVVVALLVIVAAVYFLFLR